VKKRIEDETGGMEGVPLQLIIVIVIGVAALGILIGWLAMAGDPDPVIDEVSTDPEDITVKGDGRVISDVDVEIYVYDSEGNEVDDVIVTFSGSVDDPVTQKIDSGDKVKVTARLADGVNTGTIHVVAEKGGGMGSKETTIIVIRG
jgi:hypothetical protein